MITMVGGTKAAPSREALGILGLAQKAARAEDMRQRPSGHVEDGGSRAGIDRKGRGD